jgi:hypothetical protein
LPPPGRRDALRHTYATRLAEDGASATEIQALLGHESLDTSQGYIDATANATRQAARANRTYRVVQRIASTPQKGQQSGVLSGSRDVRSHLRGRNHQLPDSA